MILIVVGIVIPLAACIIGLILGVPLNALPELLINIFKLQAVVIIVTAVLLVILFLISYIQDEV